MNRSEGGVEVGDVDAKAKKLLIPVDGSVSSGFHSIFGRLGPS